MKIDVLPLPPPPSPLPPPPSPQSTAYMQNTTDRFLTELRAAIDSDGSNATALAAVTTLDMATPVLGAEFAEIASQVDVQTPSTVVDAVDFVELVRCAAGDMCMCFCMYMDMHVH